MLHIKSLTHVYPNGTRALDDVTLALPRGMFGLLGPNGAGKSSRMRCIATLQLPTSGSIRFGEIDVLSQPDALRRTLGYLPQDFGVYPRRPACPRPSLPRIRDAFRTLGAATYLPSTTVASGGAREIQ